MAATTNVELAFEQLVGRPCEPQTAMQFGRYSAAFLPDAGTGKNLVLGVSVSGQVNRTIEALNLGRQAGLAKTANPLRAAQMGLVSASLVIEGYGALFALSVSRKAAKVRLQQLNSRQPTTGWGKY